MAKIRATGIVRTMDDLNRVVLPKQMFNQLGIKEKQAFEYLTTDDGDIILRKYDPELINELARFGDKHIIFTQSHERSKETTQKFVSEYVSTIEYIWTRWTNDLQEPPMCVPMSLFHNTHLLNKAIDLYRMHYVEGTINNGEIIMLVDVRGNLVIDVETDEFVFLYIDGCDD